MTLYLSEDADIDLDALSASDPFSYADSGEGYDSLPTDTAALIRLTIAEATNLEAAAERLADVALTAGTLADELARVVPTGPARLAAERFRRTATAAAARADDAANTARHTIRRTRRSLDGDDDSDDERYEDVLTARLHVPIARSMVDDAVADAVPALRHLARLALAVALAADDDHGAPLERLARAVLRRPLVGLSTPRLADEDPDVWSVSFDELRLELAGLLANMVADHRTFLIAACEGRTNRFVQALTFDADLHVESVEDQFLPDDEQLTDTEGARLAALGWEPPSADAGRVNWQVRCDEPVDVHAVADLLLATLIDVHGLTTPLDLALTTHESCDPIAG